MNLFDYQVRTVKEVLKKFRSRALLCDEVGLGKTIEACTVMMEYIIRGFARRILILVPPSLVNQWSDELRRKFNQNFITSDDPRFKDMGDEAHHLKNRKTVAWNFVKSGELMEPKNIEKLRALVSDVMVRDKRSDVDIKFTKRYAETIVFTKYKTTVKFLEKLLKQNGYKIAVFYGGMTRREKDGQIENFRNESQILLSTETGYSLIYVVIPYECKDIFGKTELKLCFDSDFSKNLSRIFYDVKPQYDYPVNCDVNFLAGFKKAVEQIKIVGSSRMGNFKNIPAESKEVKRIDRYYASLKAEAEKRMKRKNLSEGKVNEYEHKINLYDVEKNRQINEIKERCSVKLEIIFQNTVVYAVPIIYFKCKSIYKNKLENELGECCFNKITGQIVGIGPSHKSKKNIRRMNE